MITEWRKMTFDMKRQNWIYVRAVFSEILNITLKVLNRVL